LDGWNELKCGDVDAKASPMLRKEAIRAHLVPACTIVTVKDDWLRIALRLQIELMVENNSFVPIGWVFEPINAF
jgi:hypothetical protein